MGLKIRLLILLTLCCFLPASATDVTDNYIKSKPQGNSLNEKQWDKLKDDYKYKSIQIDTTRKNKNDLKIPNISGGFNWFKILAYLFVFALIVLVLYLLFRYGYFGDGNIKNKKTIFSIVDNPEDINDLDIDPLLSEALKNKNYRLALRLKYLALLKHLSATGMIKWKRELTNRHYADQLRESEIYNLFLRCSYIYELGWYGNYEVDEAMFLRVQLLYQQITNLKEEHV